MSLTCYSGVSAEFKVWYVEFKVAQMVKNVPDNAGDIGSAPGSGDPLKKGMAPHSSILG